MDRTLNKKLRIIIIIGLIIFFIVFMLFAVDNILLTNVFNNKTSELIQNSK